jgi:hypothetical protein
MIEPNVGGVSIQNHDLSEEIKDDYYEGKVEVRGMLLLLTSILP